LLFLAFAILFCFRSRFLSAVRRCAFSMCKTKEFSEGHFLHNSEINKIGQF